MTQTTLSQRCRVVIILLCLLLQGTAKADSVVVFNEVMYHPATNEPALEWIELHNQNAVDVDLSGWRLTQGLDYIFPNGTVIKGTGYLVVAVAPTSLTAATGVTNVTGPFSGRLSNNGEEIRLRDLSDRLMDTVAYGVDGDWPVSPDGGGTSLAKRGPNLSSRAAENWTASTQLGGTPGTVNFSAALVLGPKTNIVSVAANWRFEDSGADLGSAWRSPAFDDSAWPSGAALFYVEDGALPGPKNTPLAPNRNTYYFRGTFQLSGNPADKVITVRPFVDDGGIVYVNGTEVARFNMPAGSVSYSTMAVAAVANADYTGPFNIPSSALVTGQNVIAVEVHQTTATTNAGLRILTANGSSVIWDGGDGDFFSPGSPALAPTNSALASLGVEILASSNTNLATNLIDGRYGNASSWSPAPSDPNPTIVLRFGRVIPVSSIAWSRDNGDTAEAGCPGGTCIDRALGNYTFQYTLVTNPVVGSGSTSNPTNAWVTLATVQHLSTQPSFTPHLRHRFDFTRSNAPIFATGIRFRPTTTNTIDEIEINPPTVATFDAVFGMELTTQDILPPPPKLVFNEISAANGTNTWLEVINADIVPAELGGVQIVGSGGLPPYVFPSQTLAPGEMASVTQAQLGFGTAENDKLFLYTAGRSLVLDAVTVRTNSRGRFPDGTGPWLFPAQPSPGTSNVFALHDEIVFNEIMYRAAPLDPVPALTTNVTAVRITNSWRYHDLGTDLGSAWRAANYDDTAWAAGMGLMYFNIGALPAAHAVSS